MNILITKEQIEEYVGYKINDFKLEPLYKGETLIGLSVNVVPIVPIDRVNISFIAED